MGFLMLSSFSIAALASRGVRSGHESTNGVVDKRSNLDGKVEVVNLVLEQSADVLAYGIGDIKALGPSNQQTLVNGKLLDGETEGEAQTENVLIAIALRGAGCVAPAQVRVEVVGMVLLQEDFDLLCEEREEVC
ncbi:hypothetical protein HG531_012819 [Fusarium graminearum]|nr:hypothetical protein HG531_012819 [Fusarium graminearum]